VFSIIYKEGNERVVFSPDTLDPLDFKVEEMRSFIRGEQDAQLLYKNNLVRVIGLGVGAGSGLLAIYGLVGPPLYSTVLGAFSPNIEKQLTFKVSGDAAGSLGIQPGKYLNEVSAKNSTVIKKDQKLKINHTNIRFRTDSDINEAVKTINSKFHCSRVRAANENDRIKLYKGGSLALVADNAYREGYSKKVRDYRIRNGLIYGFIGFILGSVAYTIAAD
jgi:hypothetical protein